MPIYAIFSFLALLLFALETITQKLTTKYLIKNPLVFNFYFYPFALLFVLPVFFSKKIIFPFNLTNISLAAFFNVTAHLFYVFALYKIDVSIISPMYNLRTVFSTLLAIFLLGEILPQGKYLWLVVVIVAGFFVTIDERMTLKSFFQKPVFLLLFYFLGLSLMSIFIKKGIHQLGYWNFNFWYQLVAFIFVCFTIPFFIREILITKKQFLVMAFLSLLGFMGGLAANKAYENNITVSTAIISLPGSMILAFVLSRIRPKLLEHHSIKVYLIRFIAAASMFYAVLQLI